MEAFPPAGTAHARARLTGEGLAGWGPLQDTTCVATLGGLVKGPQYRPGTQAEVSGKDGSAEGWTTSGLSPSGVPWRSNPGGESKLPEDPCVCLRSWGDSWCGWCPESTGEGDGKTKRREAQALCPPGSGTDQGAELVCCLSRTLPRGACWLDYNL